MSRLAHLKEEENTLRLFLSKIQTQLDALAVEELALKSRIRRKQENLAKESNKSNENVNACQSNSLKQPIQVPTADGRCMNSELLDLEVTAPAFVNKKEEKEEADEEESDEDDQMMTFIKLMSKR